MNLKVYLLFLITNTDFSFGCLLFQANHLLNCPTSEIKPLNKIRDLQYGICDRLYKKSQTGAVRWAAKRPEAFGFALIFFVTFLHQGKKVNQIN